MCSSEQTEGEQRSDSSEQTEEKLRSVRVRKLKLSRGVGVGVGVWVWCGVVGGWGGGVCGRDDEQHRGM